MQDRRPDPQCHGGDQTIHQSTNGDAALTSSVEQLDGGLEIVARVDEFEVDGLEQASQRADLGTIPGAVQQLGLDWFE